MTIEEFNEKESTIDLVFEYERTRAELKKTRAMIALIEEDVKDLINEINVVSREGETNRTINTVASELKEQCDNLRSFKLSEEKLTKRLNNFGIDIIKDIEN